MRGISQGARCRSFELNGALGALDELANTTIKSIWLRR
jgi:hypothetical protein